MCPFDVKSDGSPLASTVKMQETGRDWAKGWRNRDKNITLTELAVPNEPTTGIYIGSSVERYSTSNKLFRVQDPRGFTVEVPTDNIATLLHNSTVVNGYIQEPCVWARDGGHILLPVNSNVYREAKGKIETVKSGLTSLNKLVPGDRVAFFEETDMATFLGRVKLTWHFHHWRNEGGEYSSRPTRRVEGEDETIKDDKYTYLFLQDYSTWPLDENGHYDKKQPPIINQRLTERSVSAKVVSVETGPAVPVTLEMLTAERVWLYCPQRVLSRLEKRLGDGEHYGRYGYRHRGQYDQKIVAFEMKP